MAKDRTPAGKKIKMPFKWSGCPVAAESAEEVHFPCRECTWELPGEVTDGEV